MSIPSTPAEARDILYRIAAARGYGQAPSGRARAMSTTIEAIRAIASAGMSDLARNNRPSRHHASGSLPNV